MVRRFGCCCDFVGVGNRWVVLSLSENDLDDWMGYQRSLEGKQTGAVMSREGHAYVN